MNGDRERMRDIFDQARRLPIPERASFLNAQVALDGTMRAQIEDMLSALSEAGPFLSEPTHGDANADPSAGTGTFAATMHEGPGTRIGPYKLLQLIGEGGFGSVFMAEQEKPVSRKVALKIIKLGMDTRQVIARFEAERQALAMMDHSNIARVLDAGATENGRPYFVLELVKGDPIVQYCDKNNLSIEDRLELFAQVCHAVQHAHTKGIIHRDIKPSNILVSTQDGRPQTKVIDFGIAKATESRLTEKTLFTEHKALIGTPEYMSPEQAEGSLDIDTRTDVYSLGVLLYELLTGTTPFASKELRAAAYGEIQRIIREVEPPKPSTRISHNTETIADVAARRHTEPKRLGTLVRGELDWIVMKAMEKDRQRRYETANGLGMDIWRYLRGEPVLAAPVSKVYRLRKFVRRNRVQVAAAALIAIALLLGLAGTAWEARVASGRAAAALKAEGEAKTARDAEKARADELNQISEFQEAMLAQVDPTLAGQRLTEDVNRRFAAALAKLPEAERSGLADAFRAQWARVNATDAAMALIDATILKPAVRAIDEKFKNQPVVDARLRQALADVYRSISLHDAAFPLQESALATRRRVLGEDHPDTLISINNMGLLLQDEGKFTEAEADVREALERFRRTLGEDQPETLTSMSNLAMLLMARGKLVEAEACYREAAEKSPRVLGEEDPQTLKAINGLATVLQARGKLAEAEPYYREVLEKRRRVLGEEHPQTLTSINNLGNLLQSRGKLAEAEPYYREVLEKRRRLLGEEDPRMLNSMGNMAFLLHAQGKFAEADRYFREVLEKRRRVLGEQHPDTLVSINNMGFQLQGQGKLTEAEPYYREALEKRRRVLGEEHPQTLTSLSNMGNLLQAQGKLAEAEPYCRETLEKIRRVLGEEHLNTITTIGNLGNLLVAQGKLEEAEVYCLEALEKSRRVLGEEHPQTLNSICFMGNLLRAQGKCQETIDLLGPAESKVKKANPGGNSLRVAKMLCSLGRARAGLGWRGDNEQFTLAETNLLEAYPILVKTRGETNKDTLDCVQWLVDLYAAWDRAQPGKGYDAKVTEWRSKIEAAETEKAELNPKESSK